MRGLGAFLRSAWQLALPYYKSEERWFARGLLAAIIALNLLLVAFNVLLNFWNGQFFDTLQNKDSDGFISLLVFGRTNENGWMPGFTLIVLIYIPIAIYRTYLRQWLQIRWRGWLTASLTERWLSDRAYYRISLLGDPTGTGTDNPDQRIADDVRTFVDDALILGLDLLTNLVTLFSFLSVLWTLSGTVTLLGVSIPGYMVWVALVYSVLGTGLAHLVGWPLTSINFRQERFEADFRFSLTRVRENTEGIALYGGEAEERRTLAGRFANIAANWYQLIWRTKLLNAFISGYSQVANIFPFVVAAPRYFAGEITLGGLTRTASAFGQVQDAMSWFITSYSRLASWQATVNRLTSFEQAISTAKLLAGEGVKLVPGEGTGLRLDGVTLRLPDGSLLIDGAQASFPAGQSTVIQGRSGSGKSTLFRALAGIWPFGAGQIERPAGSYLFIPQRSYIPLGTLRHAITYPAPAESFDDARVTQALSDAGLDALRDQLDEDAQWAQRLSGGEQQRLALARALLLRPDWLFLDEATANLDPEAEAKLYECLRTRLPGTTIISIAHRTTVADLHDHKLVFRRQVGKPGNLAPADPAAA